MASEPTLNLDLLCAAISEDNPAGPYIRESNRDLLQRAKDARSAAVAAEKRQRELEMYSEEDLMMMPDEDRRVQPPDWRAVRDLCVEILGSHSKDLWVASWLIEANARLSGFAGLRDGFRLVTQLVEQYWDRINPPPDEDEGYLDTVSQLSSLNGVGGQGTLVMPIESISLLPGESAYSFAAHRHSLKTTEAKPAESEFYTTASKIGPQRLQDQFEDIEQAIAAFEQMSSLLNERCGTHDGVPVAPPSTQIRQALQECQRTLGLIARDLVPTAEAGDESEQAVSVPGVVVDPAKKAVNNREDAFRLLLQASEFFLKTEPHSPVGYMLQKAVRIGRMPLPDLLQEMITDEEVLKRFAERTGIDIKKDSDDD